MWGAHFPREGSLTEHLIYHIQRRKFKWMGLEPHSNSLVLFTLGFRLVHLHILYFQNFYLHTSSLGFDSGVTSSFMPGNKSKRRKKYCKQQILAGSIWHRKGSFGLLWYELGRYIIITSPLVSLSVWIVDSFNSVSLWKKCFVTDWLSQNIS